jgi:hypothetical protein
VSLVLDLDLANTSRVELEHVLVRTVRVEGPESFDAAAIRAELASRVWQHDNPYAEAAS